MKKKLGLILLVALMLFGGAGLYVLQQNSFDIVEQSVDIATPEGTLTGTLALPKKSTGLLGLVLFIHGDGPINASHSDGYKPLWERLADQGYASLSLNKRGIEGSEGNWLDQSIDDRVEEARQAIAWAKTQSFIDEERIGVWGASQAGWVIPKLAGQESLAFSILVSPAVNWLTQGEYNTRSQMAKDRKPQEEINEQIAYENRINDLLKKGASYDEYVTIAHADEAMSKERWTFVSKNWMADATSDLHHFQSPVLLLLGEDDINVDVKETEQVYREEIEPSSLLTVKTFPHTEHSMLETKTADSTIRSVFISLFAPRSITTEGYMNEIDQFLGSLPE